MYEMPDLKLFIHESSKQKKETCFEPSPPNPISAIVFTQHSIKLETIKWPSPYDQKDQILWKSHHSPLKHIYKRDILERKILEP